MEYKVNQFVIPSPAHRLYRKYKGQVIGIIVANDKIRHETGKIEPYIIKSLGKIYYGVHWKYIRNPKDTPVEMPFLNMLHEILPADAKIISL